MNGEDCIRQVIMSKTHPGKLSLQTFTCNWATIGKNGKLFGYVHCNIEVPESLTVNFANLLEMFKNTSVSKNDIRDLIKTYAEKKGIKSQPGKLLISNFRLKNGSLINPLIFLSWIRSGFSRNTPVWWVHSKKVIQRPRTVSCRCQTTKGRESHMKCWCRNNEDASW